MYHQCVDCWISIAYYTFNLNSNNVSIIFIRLDEWRQKLQIWSGCAFCGDWSSVYAVCSDLHVHLCLYFVRHSLRKVDRSIYNHYENTPIQIYWKIYYEKNENFQIKNSDIFHISAQNIDCGYSLEPPRRGGSNEYPQSMFLSRNKKSNVYPFKPQFYYIKVGFKGVKII